VTIESHNPLLATALDTIEHRQNLRPGVKPDFEAVIRKLASVMNITL
jgi:hypothetical protein